MGLRKSIVRNMAMLILSTAIVWQNLPEKNIFVKASSYDVVGTIELNEETDIEYGKTGYYRFVLPEDGSVWGVGAICKGINKDIIAYAKEYPVRLPKGEYFICNTNYNSSTVEIKYKQASSTDEIEDNDTFDTAMLIEPNTAYKGNLQLTTTGVTGFYDRVYSKDVDIYKVVLNKNGSINIKLDAENQKSFYYYDGGTGIKELSTEYLIELYSEDKDMNVTKICQLSDYNSNEFPVFCTVPFAKGNVLCQCKWWISVF